MIQYLYVILAYVKLYEKEIEIKENENSFKKLINICKKGGKYFSNDLLNYKSIDLDVIVYYLNLDIITWATVKFKDMMTYIKLYEKEIEIVEIENSFKKLIDVYIYIYIYIKIIAKFL